MCITEYNEERTLDQKLEEGIEIGRAEGKAEGKAEGRAEGKAEGLIEGTLKTLIGLVKDGLLPLSEAAKRAGMSISEFEEKSGLKA